MNVPESDARASSFFFLAPDCWCRFMGIVVHQLWSFAFSRNHKVWADAGMAHHILLFIYLCIYLFIYLLSNWDGAPLGVGALHRLRTLRIGNSGTDHTFIQNLSRSFRFTASSLQFTSLIFYRIQVRGLGWIWQKLHFVLSDAFLCWFCFGSLSWGKIQTWPIIRFLTEAVRFWFFICWYLIESMMPCIWTRCSGPPAEI